MRNPYEGPDILIGDFALCTHGMVRAVSNRGQRWLSKALIDFDGDMSPVQDGPGHWWVNHQVFGDLKDDALRAGLIIAEEGR